MSFAAWTNGKDLEELQSDPIGKIQRISIIAESKGELTTS